MHRRTPWGDDGAQPPPSSSSHEEDGDDTCGASEIVESEVAVDLSFVASAEEDAMHLDHDQPGAALLVDDPEPGSNPGGAAA